jgi:hypothetical protein
MEGGESIKQKDAGDILFGFGHLSKPFWVRHFGLQTKSTNQRLLEYNVRFVWIFGIVIWTVLSIF